MMGSLYSGISGLQVHQTKMDVIGNNIANVNTIGFKKSTVNFEEALSRTLKGARAAQDGLGGTNPVQIGLGTQISNITTNFTSGTSQSTGVETDLRLDGNGFFIVNDGNADFYTRAGNFDLDANGTLCNSSGLKVQGWQATKNADGTMQIEAGASVGNLKIAKGDVLPGKATTEVEFSGNLDQRAGLENLRLTVDDGTGTGKKVDVDISFSYDSVNEKWLWKAQGPTGTNVTGSGAFKLKENGTIDTVIDAETTPIALNGITIIRSPLSGEVKFTDAKDATNYSSSKYTTHTKVAANNVYDSLGTAHTFNMQYTKVDQNIWDWEATVSGNLPVTNGKGFLTFDSTGQVAGNFVYAVADSADPTRIGTFKDADGNSVNSYPTATELGISADPALYASYLKDGDDPAANSSPYKIDSRGIITYRGVKDASGTALAQDEYGNAITLPTLTSIPENGEIMNVKFAGAVAFDPAGAGGALPPQNGANQVEINPSFAAVTQFSSGTTAAFKSQDGYGMGTLETFKITDSGEITGYYSNGYKQTLGKIAVASFVNNGGLEKVGGSLFTKTPNSGEAVVMGAGTGGTGSIISQSLEMSNVDLASELTDMIVAQRGFQANSKTISTADTLLETVISLKR